MKIAKGDPYVDSKGGIVIFSKIQSKREAVYLFLVVGVSISIFSIADQQIWLYVMAILIFLSMYLFRKPNKKDKISNFLGLTLLCLIIFLGENLFFK